MTVDKVKKSNVVNLLNWFKNTISRPPMVDRLHISDEEEDLQVSDWISTGSSLLDLAISNRKNGGLPVGRIIELSSQEAAGKSLICAHILAETQKMGGHGVLIDTENAAAPQFWEAVGLNVKNLNYISLQKVEIF
jgi:recombination protein RecA